MEQLQLSLEDNVQYFPNVVLYDPLKYINCSDDNQILHLSFPEYEVDIKYKIPKIQCYEIETNDLREHMRKFIKDQHDEILSLSIDKSQDNVDRREVSGNGIGSYVDIFYKVPYICTRITQYTNPEIQQELLKLVDMVESYGQQNLLQHK